MMMIALAGRERIQLAPQYVITPDIIGGKNTDDLERDESD